MKIRLLIILSGIVFLGCGNVFCQIKRYKKVPSEYIVKNSDAIKSIRVEIDQVRGFNLERALPNGYVKDGSIDYTTIIQDIINSHDIIIFPGFPLLINDKGLSLKSNSSLIFEEGSKLILKPSKSKSYSILSIKNSENINIYFPKIYGDRRKHLSKEGEWGMGISIYGGRNIKIINPQISECWGDGIYIANTNLNITNNILIQNAFFDYNRRNGLTVVGGNKISILNSIAANTIGIEPMAGIDIEPNKGGGITDNIVIDNFTSFNNGKSGLQIGLSRYPDIVRKEINISISDYYSYDNLYGIILGGFYTNYNRGTQKVRGNITFNRAKIVSSLAENIKIGRNYHFGPSIVFNKLFFNNNSKSKVEDVNIFAKKIERHPQIRIIH